MAKKKLVFEDAIKRLDQIVKELEDGQLSLEKSLQLFTEGIEISKFCQESLEDAEKRIYELTKDAKLVDFKDNEM
ncbi:MAG: exodeoxyribonuclease VII small subunit [Peptococcaceae bacterium]|nr:exodeoxyribonuclease VII small subunit [Peptococcaceae bacterium]